MDVGVGVMVLFVLVCYCCCVFGGLLFDRKF